MSELDFTLNLLFAAFAGAGAFLLAAAFLGCGIACISEIASAFGGRQ